MLCISCTAAISHPVYFFTFLISINKNICNIINNIQVFIYDLFFYIYAFFNLFFNLIFVIFGCFLEGCFKSLNTCIDSPVNTGIMQE